MKVGVVGAGAVGAACLLSLLARGVARELVIVNRNSKRAEGMAADLRYGSVLGSACAVRAGGYDDLAGAAVVMIAAGVNEKSGGATDRADAAGRLRLLEKNVAVYREILPPLREAARDAVILVLTDPPDPLADLVRREGFPHVLSSGTLLDSLRFRFHLAERLEVAPSVVDAYVVGEHGTSEVLVWSSARVAGVPVLDAMPGRNGREELRRAVEHDVRFANITIIEGIGASQYGIGMVAARIAEIVGRDERGAVPIGSYQPEFGVTLSLPSVVGRAGVERVLPAALSERERHDLEKSAATLREALARL